MVLDGDFAVTRTVPETALPWKSASMMKGARLQATLSFTESQKGERFVLLLTSGHRVGRPTPKADLGPNVCIRVPSRVFIELREEPIETASGDVISTPTT